MQTNYCKYCDKVHELKVLEHTEVCDIKEEKIEYTKKEYLCEKTNKIFTTPDLDDINQLEAKDIYRKKHSLLTSKEIKQIREKYSLSQSDLALILGWGEVTITRYETKEIQNEKYDNVLRKIDDNPYILYDYFEINKDCFDQKKQIKISKKIISVSPSEEHANKLIEQSLIKKHFTNDSIYRGNSDININRILAVLKKIVDSGFLLYKTKIGKVLWYIDILFFQKYNYSITGLSYFNMKYGACPLGLDLILDSPSIEIKEIIEDDYVKTLVANVKSDYELTPNEIEIIDLVIAKFKDLNTNQIIEYMHKEKAYIETNENQFISFEYANTVEF